MIKTKQNINNKIQFLNLMIKYQTYQKSIQISKYNKIRKRVNGKRKGKRNSLKVKFLKKLKQHIIC